jgi:hypothetical protein
MAITTLAGALAGLQDPRRFNKAAASVSSTPPYKTLWAVAPEAGSYSAALNGVALSAPQTGQIPWRDPPSGNTYLAGGRGVYNTGGAGRGHLLVLDRLWHNGGYTITSTAAQNSTTPAWPARDINGSTNGEGVLIALEVSAQVGAATPTMTLSYTNSGGTAGRTAVTTTGANSGASTSGMYIFGLDAGDTGVRSVQSLTLSASWISGTINLVAFRLLAAIPFGIEAKSSRFDPLATGFCRMYDGSVPYLALAVSASNATAMQGELSFAQG